MELLGRPGRMLLIILAFLGVVVALATLAYRAAGWSLGDSFYMVLLTIYTVGYQEVHPIDTAFLRFVTLATMVTGCTGVILLTGALVQFLTLTQLQNFFGTKHMQHEVDKLSGHVMVVGFGRIGQMLALELKNGGLPFVVLEQDERRVAEARELGYLCVIGDATEEALLQAGGIGRARTLASVLPNDAANVFITLSARSLNPNIEIIARGEAPATETKLLRAGANRAVLPAHIGAERIAEMILYPETLRYLRSSEDMSEMDRALRGFGLELQVIVAPEYGALTGLSVREIERRGGGQFFIVQIDRAHGEVIGSPAGDVVLHAGDGVVVVGRGGQAVRDLFEARREKSGAGRPLFLKRRDAAAQDPS